MTMVMVLLLWECAGLLDVKPTDAARFCYIPPDVACQRYVSSRDDVAQFGELRQMCAELGELSEWEAVAGYLRYRASVWDAVDDVVRLGEYAPAARDRGLMRLYWLLGRCAYERGELPVWGPP